MSSPKAYDDFENSIQTERGPAATESDIAATSSFPYLVSPSPNSIGAEHLTIAVIGPDDRRRAAAVSTLAECAGADVREVSSYPLGLDDVARLLKRHYDVFVVDLDCNPQHALELVERLSANGLVTVMVYSDSADPELLVSCMRAGAREFLTLPFDREAVAGALVRAAVRRPVTKSEKKATGRLLAFVSAKGGAGVTTVATNFAVALAQESDRSTLLIDLDLPLGDVALNLGIALPPFSAIDALKADGRLDGNLLSQLVVKHTSGLSVLAAPGRFVPFEGGSEAIDRLLNVARQEYEHVVVDLGARFDWSDSVLLKEAAPIFLVTQAGIPELRNSNRLISQVLSGAEAQVEIVLNRYEPRTMGIDETQIAKALTRPAQWKIPNDYAAVRRMQENGTPLTMADSPISRLIRQMARAAAGMPAAQTKKKGFSLFG